MANPYFSFKQFTVWHDRCAMKVGTDGVLLGAWANTEGCMRILDVGTGTGLIALMLAQRCPATVEAIDIDLDACVQARANVAGSPFADRVEVHHQPFDLFVEGNCRRYDLIVSNPPYFAHSLKCPERQRTLARHTDSLLLSDLLSGSVRLLTTEGSLSLVLPYDRREELLRLAENSRLAVTRFTHVIPLRGGEPKRLLATLSPTPSPCMEAELVIEESRHCYSPEFKAMTAPFYL